MGYPGDEGFAGVERMVTGGPSPGSFAIDPLQPTGAWYRVRLQIFPDGTCGVAVNGRARWRSTSGAPPRERYRLVIGGNSVGSRMLVGPVEVWTGVRNDVNWGVVGR